MSDRRVPATALDATAIGTPSVAPAGSWDAGLDLFDATLPAGHPAWQRDVVSISSRVRALLRTLKPIAVRVLSFWDHVVRSTRIDGRLLEVDPSGSYRLR